MVEREILAILYGAENGKKMGMGMESTDGMVSRYFAWRGWSIATLWWLIGICLLSAAYLLPLN